MHGYPLGVGTGSQGVLNLKKKEREYDTTRSNTKSTRLLKTSQLV